jgi:hypothetical protein
VSGRLLVISDCRGRRTDSFRKRIPLRNDENHVCARAAQPPRVALYKALGGFATVR